MTIVEPGHAGVDLDDPRRTISELERTAAELRHVTSVIAHDLRQPLAAITAFAEHLRQRSADGGGDQAGGLAEEIAKGCGEIRAILDAAMAYTTATADTDADTDDRTLVAVRAAVDGAWWNVQAAAREKGARLSVGSLPLVRYDPVQLRQVFQNLFANALSYVAPGVEPTIIVAASRGASGWVIEVRDNGVGLSSSILDAPLRRSHRGHPSEHRRGSGLGLLICKRIVQRHAGRLRVAPAPGGGTTVSFDVPDDPDRNDE